MSIKKRKYISRSIFTYISYLKKTVLITLAMKEFILTTRLKQNALVVYISKNLPKKCLSRLISPPVSILIQYFQLRNICVCFIKHQQPFLVQFNSNLQAFATLCLSTNWTIYSIKSFVFPLY